ncbi:MAG TPA: chemotaxis protein CheD [bacterium]
MQIAELKVVNLPDIILCLGLGSCLAVCLYDTVRKSAGVVHALLPSSNGMSSEPGKFVDRAINRLLEDMRNSGSRASDVVTKLVGGANIFHFVNSPTIGERNIESAKRLLTRLGIPIVAEDVGGNYGRSIEFFSTTGEVFVKSGLRMLKVL